MKIEAIGVPSGLTAGSLTSVAVRVTINPPLEQAFSINIRAKLMQSLDQIGLPIEQAVTLPAGGDFKILIPFRLPRQTSGDCYLDVELSEAAGELRTVGRIGFTIQ